VGTEALEMVRIEQGVPVQGNELNEDANPLEAGLLDHISFNKGCYIGQEVVARLDTYDKVQRKLVGVSWNENAAPVERAPLRFDETEVGYTTSHARSPRLDRPVALAYVRNAHAKPGTALSMDSTDGRVEVRVEGLPLTP
jgi:folate-binding protein YgfZ